MLGRFFEFVRRGEGRGGAIIRIFSGKGLNQHEQFTLFCIPSPYSVLLIS
jgi:hypothetical protein